MTDPTLHQSYMAFPLLSTPFVDEERLIGPAWYRLLEGLYLRAGQQMVASPNAVIIQQAPVGAGAPLAAYSALDGTLLGVIYLQNTGGGPADVLGPVLSPFVFATSTDGTIFTDSGKLEVSRDGGATWYLVSLTGGSCPVLKDDEVRISWSHSIPDVVLLPIKFS